MARHSPVYEPGRIYHLVSKFVGDEFFIRERADRPYYLRLMGRALQQSDWKCFAYALMSNHVHLAVRAGNEKLAEWLRDVNGPFAERVNRREERHGAVYQRGPWGGEVPEDRVPHLVAYIHRNPLRAGLVERAVDSDWTSHRSYLGQAPCPEWLASDVGRSLMKYSSPLELDTWVEETQVTREDLRETRAWARHEEDDEEEEAVQQVVVRTCA